MISTSRSVALCALAGALGIHLVSVMAFDMDEDALIEAMAGANTAALGDGFEDLAVGTLEAEPIEMTADTPAVETAETPTTGVAAKLENLPEADRPMPDTAKALETNETADRQDTELANAAMVGSLAQSKPAENSVALAEPTRAERAETESANAPSLVLQPSAEQTVAAKPDVLETVKAVSPTPTVRAQPVLKAAPVQMAALAPTRAASPAANPPPTETIEAQEQELEQGAVSQSKRPKVRPRNVAEAQPKPKPKAATKPKPAAQAKPKPKAQPKVARAQAPEPVTRGNAQQATRKGAVTGNESASAATQGVRQGTGNASGNARVSNYPGLIMRKIQRVRRPAVGSRGTAVIAFRIAASGGLSTVSVARSSGSSKLDQAAVKVVRKAAPFPKPPPGARRSFSIKIKGR